MPPQLLAVQMLDVVLLAALPLDGQLSRVDGGILPIGLERRPVPNAPEYDSGNKTIMPPRPNECLPTLLW